MLFFMRKTCFQHFAKTTILNQIFHCSITDQTVCCQPFARLRGGNSYGRSFLLLCFRKVQAGINTSLFGGGAWAEGMTCRNGKVILELRIEGKHGKRNGPI